VEAEKCCVSGFEISEFNLNKSARDEAEARKMRYLKHYFA
jgi:hypothetical protein